MTGLERLRSMMAQDPQPPIGRTLNFSLVEVEEGRAVFSGNPGRETYNPMGTVHGGYAATLLDSDCGIATFSKLQAGQSMTTLELKVAYHRAMTEDTGPVRAEGIVLSMGNRVAFVEAKLTDSEGRLLASATAPTVEDLAQAAICEWLWWPAMAKNEARNTSWSPRLGSLDMIAGSPQQASRGQSMLYQASLIEVSATPESSQIGSLAPVRVRVTDRTLGWGHVGTTDLRWVENP